VARKCKNGPSWNPPGIHITSSVDCRHCTIRIGKTGKQVVEALNYGPSSLFLFGKSTIDSQYLRYRDQLERVWTIIPFRIPARRQFRRSRGGADAQVIESTVKDDDIRVGDQVIHVQVTCEGERKKGWELDGFDLQLDVTN